MKGPDQIKLTVRHLDPGYFSIVMATGIVSIASQFGFWSFVSRPLFLLNIFFYLSLLILTGLRLYFYFSEVIGDFNDFARGPRFFTIVAGTCVLGTQEVLFIHGTGVGFGLWIFGIGVWGFLMYSYLMSAVVRVSKPSLERGIGGGWLLMVVATQSLSILGTFCASKMPAGAGGFLFVNLVFYLLGSGLYLLLIGLIFYRLVYFPLSPPEFAPEFWINMGAAAISVVAGTNLVLVSGFSELLIGIRPFIIGFSIFFWAVGSWWIPLLILLEGWRHLYKKYPLRYGPEYWAMVFPLGMYATCTVELSKVTELSFLTGIAEGITGIAVGSWAVTFAGLLWVLLKSLKAG